MTDSQPIRLTVELERGDPLRGRVGPVAGPLEAFFGWIGLATALDRMMREDDWREDDRERPMR